MHKQKKSRATVSYVALGGQVGLHCHGMFDHKVGLDFAEQIEGRDAGDQSCRVHTLVLCRGHSIAVV